VSQESSAESREPDGGTATAPTAGAQGAAWPLAVFLLLVAASLLTIQLRRPGPVDPFVGKPLPPLDAAGWLNTVGPLTAADLRGKIVAIDFWSSTCPQCALDQPELVKFHERFRDEGVLLIGLSPDPPAYLDQVKAFIQRQPGVDWPIAYGAALAHLVTNVEALPLYVLYDRTGTAVWSGVMVDELEAAVVELLARK
jgi:thiol-disulfide isomerase/thioredoxin